MGHLAGGDGNGGLVRDQCSIGRSKSESPSLGSWLTGNNSVFALKNNDITRATLKIPRRTVSASSAGKASIQSWRR